MNPYDFDTQPPEPKRRRKPSTCWTGSELAFSEAYEGGEAEMKPLPTENPEDETTDRGW